MTKIVGNVVGIPGGNTGGNIDEANLVHKTDKEDIKGKKRFLGGADVYEGLTVWDNLYVEIGELHFGTDFYMCGTGAGIDINVAGGEVWVEGSVSADSVYVGNKEVATKDDISSALGNIETALDTAIALCDSLIGGAV